MKRIVEELQIADSLGIHARPAAALAVAVRKSGARVTLRFGANSADATSVVRLLGLRVPVHKLRSLPRSRVKTMPSPLRLRRCARIFDAAGNVREGAATAAPSMMSNPDRFFVSQRRGPHPPKRLLRFCGFLPRVVGRRSPDSGFRGRAGTSLWERLTGAESSLMNIVRTFPWGLPCGGAMAP